MKIQITNKNTYPGQFEGWTEPIINEFVSESEIVVTHLSFNLIKEFQSGVMTCVYDEIDSENFLNAPSKNKVFENYEVKKTTRTSPEYLYKMIIPRGTRMMEFACGEYRFKMNDAIKIELVGTMGNMRIVDDSYDSRMYGGRNIKVFTKKY